MSVFDQEYGSAVVPVAVAVTVRVPVAAAVTTMGISTCWPHLPVALRLGTVQSIVVDVEVHVVPRPSSYPGGSAIDPPAPETATCSETGPDACGPQVDTVTSPTMSPPRTGDPRYGSETPTSDSAASSLVRVRA